MRLKFRIKKRDFPVHTVRSGETEGEYLDRLIDSGVEKNEAEVHLDNAQSRGDFKRRNKHDIED